MRHRRALAPALAAGVFAALPGVAHAQSASVAVTVNGGFSAQVFPGQAVTLNVVITFAGAYQLAELQGGVVVTPNAGSPRDFQFHLTGPQINPGSFNGPSRMGIIAAQSAPDPLNPAWFSPVNLLSYDLAFTPSQAGIYAVAWHAPATSPNVRLFVSPTSVAFAEAQTAYIGATITAVVPTPTSLALLAMLPLTFRRRR